MGCSVNLPDVHSRVKEALAYSPTFLAGLSDLLKGSN